VEKVIEVKFYNYLPKIRHGALETIIIRNSRLTISKYYFVREMQIMKKIIRRLNDSKT
jgi:hypothetical protein